MGGENELMDMLYVQVYIPKILVTKYFLVITRKGNICLEVTKCMVFVSNCDGKYYFHLLKKKNARIHIRNISKLKIEVIKPFITVLMCRHHPQETSTIESCIIKYLRFHDYVFHHLIPINCFNAIKLKSLHILEGCEL